MSRALENNLRHLILVVDLIHPHPLVAVPRPALDCVRRFFFLADEIEETYAGKENVRIWVGKFGGNLTLRASFVSELYSPL